MQLPFNVAMNEALTQRSQWIADEPLTAFEAAKRLGVGAFTSAPLSQARLLNHTRVPKLQGSKALSLIQFARSAHPAVVAPLIGQKEPGHTKEKGCTPAMLLASKKPADIGEYQASFTWITVRCVLPMYWGTFSAAYRIEPIGRTPAATSSSKHGATGRNHPKVATQGAGYGREQAHGCAPPTLVSSTC